MTNAAQSQAPKPERPEWLRPKQVPHYFGVGRSKLYELIAEGKIKSVSMRTRGAKHGTRLVSYDSLSAYLESLANNTGGLKA
jgi:excisionase family DNA binding protein